MNKIKALKLAIKALEKQRQTLAVDANAHEIYGFEGAAAVNASKKRKEVIEAIGQLQDMQKRWIQPWIC